MKRLFVIFFLIAGVLDGSKGMQHPYEYLYYYQGILDLGIPEIAAQYSGVYFGAQVILQMKTRDSGIAKFQNPVIGKDNGKSEYIQTFCKLFPTDVRSLQKYKNKFTQPFYFTMNRNSMTQLKVDKNEEEFITNVRKAVIEAVVFDHHQSIWRSKTLKEKLQVPFEGTEMFTTKEENLFGNCRVDYLIQPFDNSTAFQLHQKFASRVQRYKDSSENSQSGRFWDPSWGAPGNQDSRNPFGQISQVDEQISPTFFVKKTINFDDCDDAVLLQRSSLGVLKHAERGMVKYLSSRSSVGTFAVKLQDNHLVNFWSLMTGNVVINPFGFQSQKLQAKVFRNAFFVRSGPIQTPFNLPISTKEVRTKLYQVASSWPEPENSPPWINYYQNGKDIFTSAEQFMTGVHLTDEIIWNSKSNVIASINEASRLLKEEPNSSKSPSAIDQGLAILLKATQAMKYLPEKQIEDIFVDSATIFNYSDSGKMLLVDICAASGVSNPARVLLRKMRSGEISDLRSMGIWATLSNHLASPDVIPELMDYVTSMDTTNRTALASVVHVGFATLAHRMCLDPESAQNSVQDALYGTAVCDPNHVLNKFIPYIEAKYWSSSCHLERLYLIQTLSNLGTREVFPLMSDVITKQKWRRHQERKQAILALLRDKIGPKMKKQVFEILMSVFEDWTESDEIRKAAFVAMMSWKPESTWWVTMAKRTWNERSDPLASFISYSITSLSRATASRSLKQQADAASFAEALMKPLPESFSPTNDDYFFAKYLNEQQLETDLRFEWRKSGRESLLPERIFGHLSSAFGGLEMNLLEIAFSSSTSHASNFDEPSATPQGNGNLKEQISLLLENIRSSSDKATKIDVNLLLRLLDNLYYFLPIDLKPSCLPPANACKINFATKFAKFFNLFSNEIAIPTEIGLPLVYQISSSVLGSFDIQSKSLNSYVEEVFRTFPKPKALFFYLQQDVRVMTELRSHLKVVVPWSEEVSVVGVDNVRQMTLPLNSTLYLNFENKHSFIYLYVRQILSKRFPLVSARNKPFTRVEPMLPDPNATDSSDTKVVLKEDKPLVQTSETIGWEMAGIKATVNYAGDPSSPLTLPNLIELILNPETFPMLLTSPTTRFWQISLDYEPSLSKTKGVKVQYEYVYYDGQSLTNKWKYQDLMRGLLEDSISTKKYLRNNAKNWNSSEWRSRYAKPGTKEYGLNMFSVVLQLMGSPEQKYAAMFTYRYKNVKNKEQNFTSHLRCTKHFHNGSSPIFFQVNFDAQSPRVTSLRDFREKLQSGMQVNFRGKISPLGKINPKKTLSTFQGSLELSKELKNRILANLQPDCERSKGFILTDVHSILTYDKLSLRILYNLDVMPAGFLNTSYWLRDFAKGLYFPHCYSFENGIQKPNETINITGSRFVESYGYDLTVERPTESIIVENFRVPFGLNDLTDHSRLTSSQKMEEENENPSFCDITKKSAITYDNFYIRFPMNYCPFIASMDTSSVFSWMVLVELNFNAEMELTLISVLHQLTLITTLNETKVNGKIYHLRSNEVQIVEDDAGNPVFEISTRGTYTKISFIKFFTIELRIKSFRIFPQPRIFGQVRGICGDYNRNPRDDLTGPSRCIFDSSSLFVASWTLLKNSEKCLGQKWIVDLENAYNEYSKTCPKRSYQ